MKFISIALLFFLHAIIANTQEAAEFEKRLYAAYVDGKIMDWQPIIREMRAAYAKEKKPELLYALCFAEYGYIGHCIGNQLDREAKDCLEYAQEDVRELERIYNGRHDILALQGALYGFRIMLSKFSAMYLAPKAYKLINTASASSDRYFNCSLEIGNIRYFTPKLLGGSKEEAIEYYENAAKLVGQKTNSGVKSWIWINTMLLLANAYYDTGAQFEACRVYERILQVEPQVEWIWKEKKERCK